MYQILNEVCSTHLKKHRAKTPKSSAWFDDECQASKKKLNQTKHKLRDCSTDLMKVHWKEQLQGARKAHRQLLEENKRNSWRDFCLKIDKDNMYDCMKAVRRERQPALSTIKKPTSPKRSKLFLRHIFPKKSTARPPPASLSEEEAAEIELTNAGESHTTFAP